MRYLLFALLTSTILFMPALPASDGAANQDRPDLKKSALIAYADAYSLWELMHAAESIVTPFYRQASPVGESAEAYHSGLRNGCADAVAMVMKVCNETRAALIKNLDAALSVASSDPAANFVARSIVSELDEVAKKAVKADGALKEMETAMASKYESYSPSVSGPRAAREHVAKMTATGLADVRAKAERLVELTR